jgi:FAD/FMN-containing dehydrogenase
VRVVQMRALGGAIARVPAEATAFAHRHRRFMVNVAAFYEGEEDRPSRERWVQDLARVVTEGDRSGYVGFLGDEGADRVRAAYPGATWDWLRRIKAEYDPGNLFRQNQNIPPAK